MSTILLISGWRLFFYANEGNEPIHVHCRKGEVECKYWLDRDSFDLQEAYQPVEKVRFMPRCLLLSRAGRTKMKQGRTATGR